MSNLKINKSSTRRILVFHPVTESGHKEEFADCLDQCILSFSRNNDISRILRMSVFINSESSEQFNKIKTDVGKLLEKEFKNIDFPVSYIAQPPAGNSRINIEINLLNQKSSEYKYEYFRNKSYSYYKYESDKRSEIFGTVSFMNEDLNVYDISIQCFEAMQSILSKNNLEFNNIVRQWMYVGNINKYEEFKGHPTENYQMFNAARAKHYSKVDWFNGYPSATGIGMNIHGGVLEFVAEKNTSSEEIIPLRNPRQIDAHQYTDKYIPVKTEINTPKFERGKIVINNSEIDIYVSGTAAILGEDSIPGNIEKQTIITIENINNLISHENLKNHGLSLDSGLPEFSAVRVYIKNRSDYPVVEFICRKTCGTVPIIYTIADVCREELLVEIEAVIHGSMVE